jgi:hypothetical protein
MHMQKHSDLLHGRVRGRQDARMRLEVVPKADELLQGDVHTRLSAPSRQPRRVIDENFVAPDLNQNGGQAGVPCEQWRAGRVVGLTRT